MVVPPEAINVAPVAPPVTLIAPIELDVAGSRLSVPALTVVVPLYVLAPDKVIVPPAVATSAPVPEIAPVKLPLPDAESVSRPPLVLIAPLPFNAAPLRLVASAALLAVMAPPWVMLPPAETVRLLAEPPV